MPQNELSEAISCGHYDANNSVTNALILTETAVSAYNRIWLNLVNVKSVPISVQYNSYLINCNLV